MTDSALPLVGSGWLLTNCLLWKQVRSHLAPPAFRQRIDVGRPLAPAPALRLLGEGRLEPGSPAITQEREFGVTLYLGRPQAPAAQRRLGRWQTSG